MSPKTHFERMYWQLAHLGLSRTHVHSSAKSTPFGSYPRTLRLSPSATTGSWKMAPPAPIKDLYQFDLHSVLFNGRFLMPRVSSKSHFTRACLLFIVPPSQTQAQMQTNIPYPISAGWIPQPWVINLFFFPRKGGNERRYLFLTKMLNQSLRQSW